MPLTPPTPSAGSHRPRHARDADPRPPPKLEVLVAKEANEETFLVRDPVVEEVEGGAGVCDEAERVDEEQLRPHTPPEEAEIGGVAEVAVDAVGDKAVLLPY